MQHIYTATINVKDYPAYLAEGEGGKNTLDRPGLYLAEHHALRGIRYTVGLGYLAAVIYYYGFHRPRLPFADRPLARLHHYFYTSAGYTTPLGLSGGLLYGAWVESGNVSESHVAAVKEANRRAARAAHGQYMQRKEAAERRLRSVQPWWVGLLALLHMMEDPTAFQLARMNFTTDKDSWLNFVKPYSMLWVEQRSSRVRDARFYKDPLPSNCTVDQAVIVAPVSATVKESALHSHPTKALPTLSTLPPAHPCYTKDQVDGLVSNVLTLQHDKDNQRWTRTGGRFSLYGIVTMLVAWNSGNLLFRLQMGLGAGAVAGAAVSAMKLDNIWSHM